MDGQNEWDVLAILEQFLSKKDEKEREIIRKEIMNYFQFDSKDELEHRLKNKKGKDRKKAAERDFKMFLRQLYLGFNIPFEAISKRVMFLPTVVLKWVICKSLNTSVLHRTQRV